MRSPSVYTDCTEVFIGQGIADINTNLYLNDLNYDDGWDYAYTFVQFNGWQRSNFTQLSSSWLNATKIGRYSEHLSIKHSG